MVGLKIQGLENIPSIYRCPYCLLLLRDPVQLSCGHRQCQSCIEEQKGDVIVCLECHEKIPREELVPDRGFRNDMYKLFITCSFCNWTGIFKDYQNHLNQNHSNPTCIYCNDKFTSVNDLYRHQHFDCQKVTVNCPLKDVGCDEQILRQDFPKHYSSVRHQCVIMNFLRQMLMKTHRPSISIPPSQLQEFHQSINALSTAIEPLDESLKRLETEYNQSHNLLQFVIQKFPALRKSIDDQKTLVDSIGSRQQTVDEDIHFASQKLNEIKLVSNDGIYIWPITNVQEKILASQSGTQPWIDSPPFYSSPTGYKMCLRLYLNGDGHVQGTHISLYLIFMRGEFDAILQYPFPYKLIFCLYDQTDQHDHIIEILLPNVLSNTYKRPQSEMVVAGGISKFAPLEKLQQENNRYIRDDTMFIKTIIDFNQLKNEMFPYAINLSPALTTAIQDEMIREEVQKRKM